MSNAKAVWRVILNNNTITTIPVSNGSTGYTIAANNVWNNSVMTIPASGNKVVIDEKAALEVNGTMIINGRNLEERLRIIEEVLHIPERDVKLEAKHPKLKKMYDDYVKALAKYRTFEAIKGE